jgi:hypothetical protein
MQTAPPAPTPGCPSPPNVAGATCAERLGGIDHGGEIRRGLVVETRMGKQIAVLVHRAAQPLHPKTLVLAAVNLLLATADDCTEGFIGIKAAAAVLRSAALNLTTSTDLGPRKLLDASLLSSRAIQRVQCRRRPYGGRKGRYPHACRPRKSDDLGEDADPYPTPSSGCSSGNGAD